MSDSVVYNSQLELYNKSIIDSINKQVIILLMGLNK